MILIIISVIIVPIIIGILAGLGLSEIVLGRGTVKGFFVDILLPKGLKHEIKELREWSRIYGLSKKDSEKMIDVWLGYSDIELERHLFLWSIITQAHIKIKHPLRRI